MRRKIQFILSIAAGLFAFVIFWQIHSRSFASPISDDDPTFDAIRSNITHLLASKNYHEALRETGNTVLSVTKKQQPKFIKNYQLMDLTELAAQAYKGIGRFDRTLVSRQQIVYLYPFPNISSPEEQRRWSQANALAVQAVQHLVDDYRHLNQIAAGIAYFQQLQKKYATTPLARAAQAAEQRLRSGK